MLLHNLICRGGAHPLGGKKLNVSREKKASAHLCISFFTLPLSVSFSLTLFTHYLPSLMSAHCTQGPRVSVQFLFWHPFLITHVNDWSPGLGRGEQRWKSLLHDGCVQVQDSFCCRVWGETDTCDGPRVGRLSSEHPPFGPKTLPISGPWGASHTGVARYLWLFVWSNPTQFKPRLTARTFNLTLRHLRAQTAESRTPATFVKCDLANWFWSGQSGVPGGGGKNRHTHRNGPWWKSRLLPLCMALMNLLLQELSPFRCKMTLNTKQRRLSSGPVKNKQ